MRFFRWIRDWTELHRLRTEVVELREKCERLEVHRNRLLLGNRDLYARIVADKNTMRALADRNSRVEFTKGKT